MARKFNSLPERQAKVNYLLASQEKAEAAKVKVKDLLMVVESEALHFKGVVYNCYTTTWEISVISFNIYMWKL